MSRLAAAAQFAVEPLESRRLLSASIGGTVYNDANGNHVRDSGEVAVVGQQVYLDLQGISQFVAGDPVSTTDASGAYSFPGLAAGNYLVRPVPVAGKVTTTPIYGGKFFVQLAANQNVTGDDFGIQSAGTPNFTVNGQLLIGGTTNGQATLTRYNVVDGSTDVTFGSLGVVTLPIAVTGQPTGAVVQGANTVITYPTQFVTLNGTGGVVSITPTGVTGGASISGRVLLDTVSPLQISPIPGTQVYLDLQGIDTFVSGDPVSTTDANGNYSFTGLSAGNYLVRLVPANTRFTTTPVYGGKFYVQLTANQMVSGDDFKVQFAGVAFTFNVNGQFYVSDYSAATGKNTLTRYNSDESRDVSFGTLGVAPLPIGYDGPPTSLVAGVNGNIVVTYPTAQTPTVITLSSTGTVLSVSIGSFAPTNLTASATSPTSVQLGFTDNSTVDFGYAIERSNSATGPFISVGTLPGSLTGPSTGFVGFSDNSAQPNTTYFYRVYGINAIQAGIAGPVSVTTPAIVGTGASISGFVYNDLFFDGNPQDPGDTGVAGRQVYLDLQGIGTFVNGDPVMTTDASGHYSFTNLAPANYLVRLVPQAGSVISAPIFGGKFFVQLAANQAVTGDNFGTQSLDGKVSVTQSDGKILAAGSVRAPNTAPDLLVVRRFNADGSLDVTFGTYGNSPVLGTIGINGVAVVDSISVLPNGSISILSTQPFTRSNMSVDTVTLLSASGQPIAG